jgi:hypothetical protein
MPIYRLSIWTRLDSTLERDKVFINPVINATAGPANTEQLAQEAVDAMQTWTGLGGVVEFGCKVYDVQKPKPNYPLATVIENANAFAATSAPREVALCLSFYAGQNVKRRRGRLYLPTTWIGAGSNLAVRPTQTQINKVMALGVILQDLGGLAEDWSVYSKVDGTARAVTNYWCDNEWDIQRRRGLRGTSRSEGTTNEETVLERAI